MASVPILDMSLLHLRASNARKTVVDEIGRACKTLGCFQVINHGIGECVTKDALEVARQFFNLSEDEKMALASEDIMRPVRFGANSKEGTTQKRLFLKHYANPLSEWIQLWPAAPCGYREKMGKYAVEARSIALQLMDAIMESLGLGDTCLKDKFDKGMQVMAVNSYPQNMSSAPAVGFAPHSDFGIITLLLQSCQGLQILDRGQTWKAAPCAAGALHVHIGDYMEVLSNGRYKSLIHRAILRSEQKRFSIASIHGFPMDDSVGVPEELVDEHNSKKYRDSNFRDFMNYLSSVGDSSKKRFIDQLKLQEG
ncbi:hypothetical protein HPP92_008707 [Vanilla planifolia]|uniref:Fe2OG dioxygenase domain-containing protein n=1 Tax=Vanilla planifolia TaxID=51239 RepID=A0A835RIH6_VANPL|nr:hypothetical protein HPP92_008900 [Vanilla planifolia]KAG0486612.1 hypothetical protein HPP92_008707 [Vanilla planifolia]